MHRTIWIGLMLTLAAVGAWTVVAVGQGHDMHGQHGATAGPTTQPGGAGHPSHAVSARLAELGPALDELDKAINAGDKDAALAKLKAVRELVRKAAAAANGFANVNCPIMGGPFDPADTSADLVRQWHGQKVGFCCAGCPAQWDKLTDQEKQAKLTAVAK